MDYEGNGPVIVLLMYGYDFILWHILAETNIVYIHTHPLVLTPSPHNTLHTFTFLSGTESMRRKERGRTVENGVHAPDMAE